MIYAQGMYDVQQVREPFVMIERSVLGSHSWVRAFSRITNSRIGDDVFIGFYCEIEDAIVGSSSMIASRTVIGAGAVIGEDVWIAADVQILPGVLIGARSVIGAGAIVTSDVPAQSIAIGRPASSHQHRALTHASRHSTPIKMMEMVNSRKNLYAMEWPSNSSVSDFALNDAQFEGGARLRVDRGSVLIGRPSESTPNGGIFAGADIEIGMRCVVEAGGGVQIGHHAVLGNDVTVLTSSHDHSRLDLPWTSAPVQIGAGTIIESGATIIGPIKVGPGALILSGHVVVKDVPAGATSKSVVKIRGGAK